MGEEKEPIAYRLFRRFSDAIIAIAAMGAILLGLFKWLYLKPVMTEEKISEIQNTISEINSKVEEISNQVQATDRRLTEFQKSFKPGKPGRWVLKGRDWIWQSDN